MRSDLYAAFAHLKFASKSSYNSLLFWTVNNRSCADQSKRCFPCFQFRCLASGVRVAKVAQIETDKKSAEPCFDTNQLEADFTPRLLVSFVLTFFGLVVAVLAVVAVVVEDALVVVVLPLPRDASLLVAGLVVLVAVKPVVLQGVAVAGDELALTGNALEAIEVENPVPGAHHVIAFSKRVSTLITFRPKEADVVLLAVGLAVPHKAGAVLVQEHLALVALE